MEIREVDGDIQIYTNDCLENNDELAGLPAVVEEEIAETIASKSKGM